MITANKLNNKYEIGDKRVIPITEVEYNTLKEKGYEKHHHSKHSFIIVSESAGFSKEEVQEWTNKIKEYYAKETNSNKIKIIVEENNEE